MKKMKKFIALILTFVLVIAMAAPAMAEPSGTVQNTETYTLTLDNSEQGHSYDVYQIFSVTLFVDNNTSGEGATESESGLILSNIQWGSSIKNGDELFARLTTDTTEFSLGGSSNTKTTLKNVFGGIVVTEGMNKADAIADVLAKGQPAAVMERFAEVVGEVSKTVNGNTVTYNHTFLNDDNSEQMTYDNGVYVIDGLEAGYYLVKDQDGTQEGEGKFYTQYILQVVHSTTISVKGEAVRVTKGIDDTIDGEFGAFEDFDINDPIYYKIKGTIPSNIDAYLTYQYEFVDTLPNGVKFIDIESIYIEGSNGRTVASIYEKQNGSNVTFAEAVEDIDGVEFVLESRNVAIPDGDSIKNVDLPARKFTLTISDLKQFHPTLTSTDTVIVKYTALMTRYALTNDANTNTVVINYDNNPNSTGTGTTIPSTSHAYTYKLFVDKHDKENSNTKLEGVEFRLYYQESSTVDGTTTTTNYYAIVVTEEDLKKEGGFTINGETFTEDMVGTVYAWTTDVNKASILDTDKDGKIELFGLDKDVYFLEETKTVGGYNSLTEPVRVEIRPAITTKQDSHEIDTEVVEYYVNTVKNADHIVSVPNAKGNQLPSTGGMGTTLFYVGGGIMALLAVVLLVTKKRMNMNE